MLARPLPAGVALGLAWGDPAGGAAVGAALELVYAGVLPVGAARYPEVGLAGLVAAGTALAALPQLGAPGLLPGIAWGLVAGHIGRGLETWRRTRNAARVAAARERARAGAADALCRVVRASIARSALEGAFAATVLLAAGIVVSAPLVDLAPRLAAGPPPAALLAALGCAAVLRLWPGRWARAGMAAGVAVGFLGTWALAGGVG
jgi:mannose/fructose/N-acetylgalactosamine-specific phosphotransferase system component IIC